MGKPERPEADYEACVEAAQKWLRVHHARTQSEWEENDREFEEYDAFWDLVIKTAPFVERALKMAAAEGDKTTGRTT